MASVTFTKHALDHMAEQAITQEDVSGVLEIGQKIEEYPDDRPYPVD